MKKNSKISIIILFFIIIFILLPGCRGAQKPNELDNIDQEQENTNENGNVDDDGYIDGEENDKDNDAEESNNLIPRAENIADYVVDLPNVDDATVFITNNTAVIGVDIGDETEGKLTTSMEQQIKNTVKTADKEIGNILISVDPDLFERIDNVEYELMRGKPLSGLGKEIEEIIRRITPNM